MLKDIVFILKWSLSAFSVLLEKPNMYYWGYLCVTAIPVGHFAGLSID